MRKKHKNVICAGIVLIAIVILSVVVLFNRFKQVELPVSKIVYKSFCFELDRGTNSINRIDKLSGNNKLLQVKVKPIGFIIFNRKIYFIGGENNILSSVDFDGNNLKLYQKCSIIMKENSLFVLGSHLYYYNIKNLLYRVDHAGIDDFVGKY